MFFPGTASEVFIQVLFSTWTSTPRSSARRGGDGEPTGHSAREAGGVLEQTAHRKEEATYPELLAARRCRLIVFGVEVGGK